MADKEREFTPQPGPETQRRPMPEEPQRRDRGDEESGKPLQLDPDDPSRQPGQRQPGQPQPGQNPGQPHPGQNRGQPRPGQPQPGEPQPGQPGHKVK